MHSDCHRWTSACDQPHLKDIYFYTSAHTLSFAQCAEHCQLAVISLNSPSYIRIDPDVSYMHSWTCVLYNNCMLITSVRD